ncbi:MAG: hypothetical protein O2816_16105, partial [Planctomycetota bacterium]|nr:hypothetical protein [Planctomycetota bacterium]
MRPNYSAALLPLVLSLPAAHQEPPDVGQIAPDLGEVYWYDLGSTKKAPKLSDLRGDVVLVHTWGYYCDSCVRKGVPLLVDVLASNEGQGLRALSITGLIEDGNPDAHFVEVGRAMGMRHALGVAEVDGSMSPYLDLGRNNSLTWCFVIGRGGAVRWAGDPSTDAAEFLEAVSAAMWAQGLALPAAPSPAFAKAVAFHLEGAHDRAAKELERIQARFAKKDSDPEAASITEAATSWLQGIEEHRAALEASLEEAFRTQDPESFLFAAEALERGFPKSAAVTRLESLRDELTPAFEEALESCDVVDGAGHPLVPVLGLLEA